MQFKTLNLKIENKNSNVFLLVLCKHFLAFANIHTLGNLYESKQLFSFQILWKHCTWQRCSDFIGYDRLFTFSVFKGQPPTYF